MARGSGFLLGMDLQVAVTAPNTLTITVLRQPAAPPAAAPDPAGATSHADSTALGGTSAGAKAASCSKKRRSASSGWGRKPPVAKRQRVTAAGGSNAAGAGRSAGAAAAAAHPQATSLSAPATISIPVHEPSPVGSVQPLPPPTAAAVSPASDHSHSLLRRLSRNLGSLVSQKFRTVEAAPPLPVSTQPEAAAAADMAGDASDAAAANSPQQGRCMSAPSALAAAAHQSTVKAASAGHAARKQAQRRPPASAAAHAAVVSRSRPASARKAAHTAQARLTSDLADSSSDEEAAEPATGHALVPAKLAAVQSGAAMRCVSDSAAAVAAGDCSPCCRRTSWAATPTTCGRQGNSLRLE